MKCPRCNLGSVVVKCDNCGDVRCNSTGHAGNLHGCGTSQGPFGKTGQSGVNGVTCHVCRKGKYRHL
ncbi:hypothetical protein Turpa_0060 [Turneriella parva DSM 21527]|uniref:Uncharacterized protein n=1 Tax=Turneriella parva (strain ATCC BAA-1111 / DSM 21527 / NCTC 11395 / H) TaxID=869212 RepID=I4B0B6_TURPD|nr:hypothetical protein Turpa_0060 [Turneriella parva DSM 21527]